MKEPEKGKVLIVDDEEYQREILMTILASEGYLVKVSGAGNGALSLCKEFSPEVVFCDLKLPDMDGIQVMEIINTGREVKPQFIIITGHGSIESAVDAIKKGAFDYVTKPVERNKILILTKRAFEHERLISENIRLRKELEKRFLINGVVGKHPEFKKILNFVRTIAPLDSTVLLLGETGTGKSMIARLIHELSKRKDKPFRTLNSAAIPETLMESELFGHERGAFTGADSRKSGLVESCSGGTLFLDEIGELPLTLQAKLLNFIEEKTIRRVGGNEDIAVDVRIIAATNKDIHDEIKNGRFREDLFYRLNVFTIKIPPLRDRNSDIIPLVNHFIEKYNLRFKKRIKGISRDTAQKLLTYSWPGNVRELETIIERAVLLSNDEIIGLTDLILPSNISKGGVDFELPDKGISLEEFERQLFFQAMDRAGGVVAKAAKLLGVSYKTMDYRLKKYKIKPADSPKGE